MSMIRDKPIQLTQVQCGNVNAQILRMDEAEEKKKMSGDKV